MEIYGKMVLISLTLWLQYSFLISLWSQWLASNYADHIKNQKRRSLSHFKTPTWLRWNHSPWGFVAVWPVAQSSLNIFVKGALYGCPNVFVIYTQSDGYSSNNKVSLCASSAYELIQIWLSAMKPHPPVTVYEGQPMRGMVAAPQSSIKINQDYFHLWIMLSYHSGIQLR